MTLSILFRAEYRPHLPQCGSYIPFPDISPVHNSSLTTMFLLLDTEAHTARLSGQIADVFCNNALATLS